ncbi:MAG TPA: hypothetical protein VNA16_07400, partial [Abditibacteriaceae bacterium]|nr:hypothetical protein [Abditibacteriaceae bacterium]
MAQNALTVILPIKSHEVAALRDLLVLIGDDIKHNPHLGFNESPSTHFARFVILDPAATPGIASLQGHGARLLFTSNYDGSFEFYMRELVDRFGAKMEPIWSNCDGYPPNAAQDHAAFTGFMRRHSLEYAAFYIAMRGVTVKTIRDSIRTREALT